MFASRAVIIADNHLLDVHVKKGDKSVDANVYLESQSLTFMAMSHIHISLNNVKMKTYLCHTQAQLEDASSLERRRVRIHPGTIMFQTFL